jgi:hypothetical protein
MASAANFGHRCTRLQTSTAVDRPDNAEDSLSVTAEGHNLHGAMRRRAARSCRVTVRFPYTERPADWAKKRPAGWSPFAGIARIRSLGVAVQPLSCPRLLSLSSRLRISPALRSVQLPRSPRRQFHVAWRRRRAPRVESPACTGRTSCFSEARGLAGRRRSCFQVLPARPFTGGGRGRALSRTDRFPTP